MMSAERHRLRHVSARLIQRLQGGLPTFSKSFL
jgi:hypothetical protein